MDGLSRTTEADRAPMIKRPRSTILKPRAIWQSLAVQAVLGLLFGYVVLHPVSMLIVRSLSPGASAMPDMAVSEGFLAPIAHSFTLAHLAMGLVFGILSAIIATLYGYHRLTISVQRDRLAEELARNEKLCVELAGQAERLARQNDELARLELANRRTTQFMAHDFKTSLNCISGFSKQLLERPELQADSEVSHALACIRRQAHRVMGSVADLLQVARVRERGAPATEAVSVAEVLREALSDFSLPDEVRQVALGDQYARCPALRANRSLLRRVLCNLVSNAIRHNKPGTHVWLDARLDQARGEVVFTCRDDGEGVPTELLASLFGEFTAGSTVSGESTGLGLAFCKTAVQSQGGRIWCENLPQGCQFCFTIPLGFVGKRLMTR